jgi:predicted AlkP superfamily pyrophosphatase or phosphodiesterase
VSLVDEGYRNADKVMMGKLRDDLLEDEVEVRLWVADLSEVDYCGHAWGSYSSQMARALRHIDELVQEFILWLKDKEMFDDSLVIISSDHGLFIGEHSFILHPRKNSHLLFISI